MAISSYKVFLMTSSNGSTYTKLVDIKEFPDLGGAPEMLDTTTLSDGARTYIPGIQETESMTFTANYTKADFTALEALKSTESYYAVWFGASGAQGSENPDGHMGKFEWSGDISAGISGGGVNEAVGMTVNCTPSTVIVYSSGS